MKRILLLLIWVVLLPNLASGLPEAALLGINRLEGTVLELPKGDPKLYSVVKLRITFSSAPKETEGLYSTYRRRTEYPIGEYKRPRAGEVILFLPPNVLPKGLAKGDLLRVENYTISKDKIPLTNWSKHQSAVGAVQNNPKG